MRVDDEEAVLLGLMEGVGRSRMDGKGREKREEGRGKGREEEIYKQEAGSKDRRAVNDK